MNYNPKNLNHQQALEIAVEVFGQPPVIRGGDLVRP
jgi:hypothetical protein